MTTKLKDLTGQKFHFLTAISFSHFNKKRNAMWLFKCDCGNHKVLAGQNVIRDKFPTKSCGCHRAALQPCQGIQATQYAVFTEGKYDEADITFEQFVKLSQEDCHYCGSSVSVSGKTRQGKRFKVPFTYHGLDRKDNSKGHTLENCVPCCWVDNNMKGKMNYQEYLDHINKVSNNRKLNESK